MLGSPLIEGRTRYIARFQELCRTGIFRVGKVHCGFCTPNFGDLADLETFAARKSKLRLCLPDICLRLFDLRLCLIDGRLRLLNL